MRWPVYIGFAVCILLGLALLNSWSLESILQKKLSEVSLQLQECSKQQSSCMEETMTLLEQRDGYVIKVNDFEKQKLKLVHEISEAKQKMFNSENKINHTLMDVELCKTELQSLKNLQVSKSATLDTLRLEKDTLTAQLTEKKHKIEELEKEIERLKLALTTKSVPNPLASSKVTPAAQPPKQSAALNAPQINKLVLDNNDAKEVDEETNFSNDIDYVH